MKRVSRRKNRVTDGTGAHVLLYKIIQCTVRENWSNSSPWCTVRVQCYGYGTRTVIIFENEISKPRSEGESIVCTTKYYTISGFGFLRATQIGPPTTNEENTASLMSEGEAKSAAAPTRAVHDDNDSEEGDTCAICLGALPRFGHDCVRFTCCGKIIHDECDLQFMDSGCVTRTAPCAELRPHPVSSSTSELFVGREREKRGP